jgi:hypothetical protein
VKGRGSNPFFNAEMLLRNSTILDEAQSYEIEFNYLINQGGCSNNQTFLQIYLDKIGNFKQIIFDSSESENITAVNRWNTQSVCIKTENNNFNVAKIFFSF